MPGVCLVALGMVIFYGYAWFGPAPWLLAPMGLSLLALATAVTEYLDYVRVRTVERTERERLAISRTADAYLAEQMRGLAAQSPELAQAIAHRIGRPDLVLFPNAYGRKRQIKIAGTEVTLGFALYVLSRSTDQTMAPQRDFQKETFHWDANHEISDRQQWIEFNYVLAQQSICTRYAPGEKVNRPPMWLPPWTPEKVISNWLLGDVLEELKPYLKPDDEEKTA